MGGKGSGRTATVTDLDAALDLLEGGCKIPEIAHELGVSPPTLRKRLDELKEKQGLLLEYKTLQSLQLTELQVKVLEAITPSKINEAPLRDLVAAFKVLKDKEMDITEGPSKVKGLIAHLVYLEKADVARQQGLPVPQEAVDAVYDNETHETPEELERIEKAGKLASLEDLDREEY